MERNESLDILKGFGIILMIVAHTYGPNSITRNFIYAFHMPLFFIVAGYFYKQRPFLESLKKNCYQLLVPYLTLCIIVSALTQVRQLHAIQRDIESTLYGMGPSWFLLAMFMARLEFHYILKLFPNCYLPISLLISTNICIIAHYYDIPLILSFFPSMVSLLFIAIGYNIKEHSLIEYTKKHPYIYFSIGIVFWLTTSLMGKVELSQCIFKLNIIDFCGSLGGTFLAYKLSQIIDTRNYRIKNILSLAGRYSLVILFYHCIDYCIPVWYFIEPYLPSSILLFVILMIRLLFVTICVIITLRNKRLRVFFRIK